MGLIISVVNSLNYQINIIREQIANFDHTKDNFDSRTRCHVRSYHKRTFYNRGKKLWR